MRKKGKSPIQEAVRAQYERFPYPAPIESIDSNILDGSAGFEGCPKRDHRLFWPAGPVREDIDILIAGCGSNQAAQTGHVLPNARITAIDLSQASIEHSRRLAEKHGVKNIEYRQMSLYDAGQLDRDFDLIISTGVIHHLPDPAGGLKALREVLRREGAMLIMVYGRYGRDSVYLLQDLFRRMKLKVDTVTDEEIRQMIALVQNVPANHPYRLREKLYSNFKREEMVDLYLHPQDVAYTVPEILDLLGESGLVLQRWLRQSDYYPRCSSLVNHPFYERVAAMNEREQWAIGELYRCDINRHAFIACRDDRPETSYRIDFDSDVFWDYVPHVRWTLSRDARSDGQPGLDVWIDRRGPDEPKIQLDAPQAMVLSRLDDSKSVRDIVAGLRAFGDEETVRTYVKSVLRDFWMFDYISFRLPARSDPPERP